MADQQPTESNELWQCGICFDDYDLETEKPIQIGENTICRYCGRSELAERFEAALANEFEPARWGQTILDANDFAEFLDEDFMKKWNVAKLERDVPLKERVYCRHLVRETVGVEEVTKKLNAVQLADKERGDAANSTGKETTKQPPMTECGKFIGDKSSAGSPVLVSCVQCRGLVCCSCKAAIKPDVNHDVCDPESPGMADKSSDMQRGRHYQLCPKCGLQTERSDGCNHMTCASCSESYCYICGVVAGAYSGHWQRSVSNCPKYNHPDDENAQFEDDEVSHDDEEDSSDDDDDDVPELEDDDFIDDAELDIRRAHPDRAWPDIDDIPVYAAVLREMGLHAPTARVLARIRAWYFTYWAYTTGYWRAEARGEAASQWYFETELCIYRILRMVVELHDTPDGWNPSEALERYQSHWRELGRLRLAFSTPAGERDPEEQEFVEDIQRDIQVCEMWKENLTRRLNHLISPTLIQQMEELVRDTSDGPFAVDDIPITEETFKNTPISDPVRELLSYARETYFDHRCRTDDEGNQTSLIHPPCYMEVLLQCYYILRMEIELHTADEGWGAQGALIRYEGYWQDFDRLWENLREAWWGDDFDGDEDMRTFKETVNASREEVVPKLRELVASQR